MESIRLLYLFNKYVQKKCTYEEKMELMILIDQSENEEEVKQLIEEFIDRDEVVHKMDDEVANRLLNKIIDNDDTVALYPEKERKTNFRFWMRTAAAVFICAIAAYWLIDRADWNRQASVSGNSEVTTEKQASILPGGDHALLTLSDGSTILLDSIENGSMQQGGVVMSKQDGLLVFKGANENEKTVSWSKITTPRGGQYKVILPDGSEVWLNASSSIRFPNSFRGKKREVEITGEAYFEVAKNKAMPFRVKVGEMHVEVLGTHFNVNAYPDELGIKTSLLEGSVRLEEGGVTGLLKPGQQGTIENGATKVKIGNFDVEEVMAWKNGLFIFNGDDIVSIMNQIGRWYDVDISFSGKIPNKSFEGKISRDAPLSDVLKILELSGVKFSVVGKRIIVK